MELRSQDTEQTRQSETATEELTRRRNPRFNFIGTADWDFFTSAEGAKPGYLENISHGGCLLRTTEPIEHRRWIRLVVKESTHGLWFTAVGRVIRREDKLEPWDDRTLTLHRYGVEFVHPVNPIVLSQIQEVHASCHVCGTSEARIADADQKGVYYCVLCHLRRACHNLLVQDDDSFVPPESA